MQRTGRRGPDRFFAIAQNDSVALCKSLRISKGFLKMELPSKNKSFEENAAIVLIFIAFGYFLIQLLYFATHISHYVPPDEITHFGLCQVFSKTLFLPENSEASYSLGLATHVPYLFYFIMGKCLKLKFFPVSDLVFLRFFNCMLSFATVVYGYKWMRLITPNRLCHLLFVILITNTPMFSLLGASVSYDNLTNLFAVTALYYLHLFFQNPNPGRFLLFGISLLGGALTKITFLPLVLAYLGVLLFHERRHLKSVFSVIKNALLSLRSGQKALLGILLLLLVLNMTLYLGNLIQFQRIVPSISQVLTEEQSMKNRMYARAKITYLYKSGQLTLDEAIEKAKEIKHPGDRADTFSLLKRARDNAIRPIPLMDRIQYSWLWLKLMLHRSVSIAGHIFLSKYSYTFAVYQLIFLFSFIFFIRYWKPTDAGGYFSDALFLCFFYGIILMQFVNYPAYTSSLSPGLSLQGRYFFPVLVPFYGIASYYLINPFKKPFRLTIFLLIAVFFIWGDFPYFLQNASPPWFFPSG